MTYIQTLFLRSIKWTLLEIKPPKEVFKSPLAMELVLNSLYQTGGHGDWFKKYWAGAVRNWFSLEIVSIEGSIHFYVRTSVKFKSIIESQIYAQYPQAEVSEVEDYTAAVPNFEKDGPIELWAANLVMTNDEVYPIKTYIDYGLDKAVGSLDEEQRIDPITPMLEFMGSIGVGEQIWFQILVRAATERFVVKNKKGEEETGKKWTDKVKAVIRDFNASLNEKDADGKVVARRATRGEQNVIESIERNAEKMAFDAGIRMMYITQKDKYDANRIAGVTGMIRQYNTTSYNGFKPDSASATSFDFPWQDLTGRKLLKRKKGMLDAYRARAYFYGGFDIIKPPKYFTYPEASGSTPFILSTEELATLYHLPGRVAETSTFVRIEATKAQPPSNLPI